MIGRGIVYVANSHTGNLTKEFNFRCTSFQINNCTELTTVTLTGPETHLDIVTSTGFDDEIAGGFTKIEVVTSGTFDLLLRR